MTKTRVGEKHTTRVDKFDSLCCKSGLLLSIVCCIALIPVELRVQEHHQLISHSVTLCGQLEREIVRFHPKNGRWKVTESSDSDLGQEMEGEYRKKREQR